MGSLDNLHDVPTNITANGATATSLRYYRQRNMNYTPSVIYNSAASKVEWDKLAQLTAVHETKRQEWATNGRHGLPPSWSAALKKLIEQLTEPRIATNPPAGTTVLAAVIPLYFEMLDHFAVI